MKVRLAWRNPENKQYTWGCGADTIDMPDERMALYVNDVSCECSQSYGNLTTNVGDRVVTFSPCMHHGDIYSDRVTGVLYLKEK
jgi:hypothetical protein